MDLKDWMECADYRITEGSEYGWNCWGSNAYSLSSWNGDYEGYSLNIIFDTKTQVVYCVEVCDYKNNRAYRFLNPDYKQNYKDEVSGREFKDEAWDGVNWTDLEVYEDWREKATAIVMGINYDTRVSVPLELSDEELLRYMTEAHNMDITFNQFVENALRKAIENHKKNNKDFYDSGPHGY